jgi:hypothetical protein
MQLESGWQDTVIDPDGAQFLDPAQQIDPNDVVTITTTDQGRIIATRTGSEVLTINPGVDETVQVNAGDGGITVINTRNRDLVLVNLDTHEAVAIVPANQNITLSVVKKSL